MTARQLKNSILQMAIQGKLVPQNPDDEPASVLIQKIRDEKEQMIRDGEIKNEKNPSYIFRGDDGLFYEKIGNKEPVCIEDETLFAIPDSWEWARFSTVANLYTGNSISENDKKRYFTNLHKGRFYIGTKDVNFDHTINYDNGVRIPNDYVKFRVAPQGSILLCIEGGSAGKKIAVTNKEVCFGNKLCCFVSFGLDYKFLYYYMQAPIFQSVFKEKTTGIIGGVSMNILKSMLIPIPPISEQMRIARKIDELIEPLNSYDLIETDLQQIDNKFPDQLKQSILQQSIQGKLVPQDSNDEPASVLIERIYDEKEQLIKDGKIKRDKHESVIYKRDGTYYEKADGEERCIDDEIPFEIPDNWEWDRLGNLIELVSGTDFKPEDYNDKGIGIPYITGASNLDKDKVIVSRWTANPKNIANKGDVLLVCKGSGYGKTVICNVDSAHIARQIMAIKKNDCLNMEYIRIFLQGNITYIKSKGQGVIPGIDRKSVLKMLFPLPPLREQSRIVDKVDQAMHVIDSVKR